MYAVIKTGGKQYKVRPGDVIEVEHLGNKPGSTTLTPILVVNDEGKTILGAKDLAAYKVGFRVLGDAKGDKVTVFKYRPKTGYASKTGHRQLYSLIEITSIGDAKDGSRSGHQKGRPASARTGAERESGGQADEESAAQADNLESNGS
ncbi:MAG: 50S ribosomal protein L21 [Actinomycetota bacterium]|nr:50S ribosomal protein L21 [Actinomycetota bacterium]